MSHKNALKTVHILYTEEEGGDFQYIALETYEKTVELFAKTVESGHLLFTIGDRIINIRPAYICLVETIDDFDFSSKRTRMKKEGQE
jgi:hypothetical protein